MRAKKEPNIEVKCEACGKSKIIWASTYNHSKLKIFFCNNECRFEWQKRSPLNNPNYNGGEYKVCDYCGENERYIKKSRLKDKNFCSKECSSKYYSGVNAPNWKGGEVERECLYCREKFYASKGEIDRGKGIYCGDKCFRESRKNQEIYHCDNCNKEILISPNQIKDRRNKCCSVKCANELKKGENNVNWAGGSESVFYKDYSSRLEPIEETRRNPIDDRILQVKCTYCDSWMTPTKDEVYRRLAYVEGRWAENMGEPRFYDKESCKENCPIFGQKVYPKGFTPATSREVQADLRKLCFLRDDWTCQKCGSKDNLHCHHIDPVINNPIESADLDNVITVCATCHSDIHKMEGCQYNQLKCS